MSKIQPAYAKYNLIQILKERLQKDISENLTSILLDEAVSNYREKIKPNIEKYVENLVIENIKSNENIMEMRTDFQVFVRIQEDEKLKTVEKTERDSCEGCVRDSDCRVECTNYDMYINHINTPGGKCNQCTSYNPERFCVTPCDGESGFVQRTCMNCEHGDNLPHNKCGECTNFMYWEAKS